MEWAHVCHQLLSCSLGLGSNPTQEDGGKGVDIRGFVHNLDLEKEHFGLLLKEMFPSAHRGANNQPGGS